MYSEKDTNRRKQNILILATCIYLLVHTKSNHTHSQQTQSYPTLILFFNINKTYTIDISKNGVCLKASI